MITEKKEAQMQRKRRACRYVRNTRKGLRRLSGQTQKGYSEELPDDNADFTDRGGAPLKQYDPKIMRSRSRFEGVSTPRNEWNRRLQTKTSLEQTSRTSTSKRYGGICSHHTHDAGKGWSKTKNKSGKPTTVSRTDTITKVANKEGVVY